jgi:hypothetical protein
MNWSRAVTHGSPQSSNIVLLPKRLRGVDPKELAQNGAQRERVPNPLGGARRTLCAFKRHGDAMSVDSRNLFQNDD